MTGLYLTSAAADAGVTAGSGTKWRAAFAPGASSRHLNKNSTAAANPPIQMTDGATAGTDGTAVSWYTDPLWGVTIAGQIVALVWDRENATNNNVAPTIRIERCSGDGTVLSTIVSETTNHGAAEMGTTAGGATDTITVTAANVTDTTLSDGDRLRITLWIDDASDQGGTGAMASGGRGEFWVNGPNGAQGQAQLTFTEAVLPQAGPKITPFEVASYTTNTTPKTITAVGALSGDLIVALYGGDNFGGAATAATVTTTGGTTSGWTELVENFGPGASSAWRSSAHADVTADGAVTLSMARTQSGPQVWGGWAALIKEHGGIGNTADLADGSTDSVSLTTSEHSLVLAIGIDWDHVSPVTAFTPSGAEDVERNAALTAVSWYLGYWVDQPAGTRNYGIVTNSSAHFSLTLIEILAPSSGTAMSLSAAAGAGAAQALSVAKDLVLGQAAGSGTPQALAASKALTLGSATGSGTPQPMSFAKALTFSHATGSGAAQALAFTGPTQMDLGPAAGTGTPQPMSFTKALTFSHATGTGAPAAIAAGKGLTLGQAAGSGAAQALAPTKALGLQNAIGSGTAQPMAFTPAPPDGEMPLGQAAGTGTPQPMSFSKALALSPVTGSGAVQALAFTKALGLGQAAGSGSARALASSKLLSFSSAAGSGAVQAMVFTGPLAEYDAPETWTASTRDGAAVAGRVLSHTATTRSPGYTATTRES